MTKQKIVVVTGASSGIGFAQAEIFLNNDYYVYAIDKNFNENLANHKNCYFIQEAAENIDNIDVLQKLEHIDILCNTCGKLDDYLPIDKMSDELWDEIITANMLSFMKMTKWAISKMLKNKQGIIINMASIAGMIPGGGGFAYTATKHAIVGMTKQLAYDYAHLGVRVNAIAPGAVKTEMTKADFAYDGKIAKEVASRVPVGRYAEPSEVAKLTLFLASDDASYIQGDIIPIDGGWLQRN